MVSLYADLPGMQASDSPRQHAIPPAHLSTPYRSVIVIRNDRTNSVVSLEFMCPWDSIDLFKSARDRSRESKNISKFCQNLIDWGFPASMIPLK